MASLSTCSILKLSLIYQFTLKKKKKNCQASKQTKNGITSHPQMFNTQSIVDTHKHTSEQPTPCLSKLKENQTLIFCC